MKSRSSMAICGWLALLFFSLNSAAQVEHQLVRRLAIFPLQTPKQYHKAAEEAWWDIRKLLTDNKRFLVASKNFLVQKDVYQARGELSPADAIILGQLLDANAVVATYLNDRTLHMKAYEGEYGRLLWEHELTLQPSVPISQQLRPASQKLVLDFISSFPYQGFVYKDSLKGSTVYEEDGRKYFKAEVGTDAELEVGDEIQLVRVFSDQLKPLFITGSSTEVFAQGRVERIDREIITVQLERVTSVKDIRPDSLVRVPKELKRLKEQFAIRDSLTKKIDPDFFSPELTELDKEVREKKPLFTSLGFIANIAAFLLLAL